MSTKPTEEEINTILQELWEETKGIQTYYMLEWTDIEWYFGTTPLTHTKEAHAALTELL